MDLDNDLGGMVTEFDICQHCGGLDFYQDEVEWERVCTGCGIVSCYEFSVIPVDTKPRTYFKHLYFLHTILPRIMVRGARLSRMDMEQITRFFKMAVIRFESTRSEHKRKNFINTHFVLSKIADALGMGDAVHPFLKLPKLPATRRSLEALWPMLNPFVT